VNFHAFERLENLLLYDLSVADRWAIHWRAEA
jgi:hypothetical protein